MGTSVRSGRMKRALSVIIVNRFVWTLASPDGEPELRAGALRVWNGRASAPVSPAGVDVEVLATALPRKIGPKHFGFWPL
jgi:hypothetical protein